ncbi:uncharacterized protein [Littorina saxatilis]|uniref:uncharacterized protein n=1 Tax=Littorina saxatilis TaxID=31220 RepID=UPI0038B59DDF
MVLFGGMGGGGGRGGGGGAGGASGGDVGAVGGSDSDHDTFYDSQTQPELGEEHLLLQIQQFQRECTEGLGPDILEAAYGVIGNVRDQSALEKELKGLLGEDMYPRFGAKILQLRALEYGLHKTSRKYSRQK